MALVKLPVPPSLTINIAIKGNSKSKHVVEWALDKFIPEGMFMFKLIIVRPKITSVPTPAGSFCFSEMRDDLVTAYRQEIEWQTDQKLLPYKRMCIRRKVDVEIVQIESDDVAKALAEEVEKSSVDKLVIGASSPGVFSRRRNVSSELANAIPKFCTVYAVQKGRLSSLRPRVSDTHGQEGGSETGSETNETPIHNTGSHPEWVESTAVASPARSTNSTESIDSKLASLDTDGDDDVDFCPGNSDTDSWIPHHQASISDGLPEFASEIHMNFELEKLRMEYRHIRDMYAMAQSAAIEACKKVDDLHKRLTEDREKLEIEKVKVAEAKESAVKERLKYEAAKREAEYVRECCEREAEHMKECLEISAPQAPPSQFICPILQEVMEDPCYAADGYTYDRKAIEIWLEENGNSPLTNLPLENKILIPNYTLLSAIMGWKSGKQVHPESERLQEFADRARHVEISAPQAPPSHFICPILQDVMEDPCVAVDGNTYDRKAIELWLEENGNSPMTNLPLQNKILIPNYTLLSAILRWKSGKQ